jgi:hypothetical protein
VGLMRVLILAASVLAVGACTHLAGVVTRSDGKPVPTAEFSIGRPTDIAHYGEHPVDAQGQFSFYISPTDENYLYVYDRTNPEATMRQMQRSEISDHMQVKLDASNIEMDPTLRGLP